MNTIKVYSVKQFQDMLSKRNISETNIEDFKNEYFISVCETGGDKNPNKVEVFKTNHKNTISLYFDDVEADGWVSAMPYLNEMVFQKAMNITQAQEIFNFIKLISKDSTIHIHCYAGRSRSVAIGLFLTEYYNLNVDDFVEMYSVDMNRPSYNKHVYQLLKGQLND
jgi:predicted protein tyrosine phosphatase